MKDDPNNDVTDGEYEEQKQYLPEEPAQDTPEEWSQKKHRPENKGHRVRYHCQSFSPYPVPEKHNVQEKKGYEIVQRSSEITNRKQIGGKLWNI